MPSGSGDCPSPGAAPRQIRILVGAGDIADCGLEDDSATAKLHRWSIARRAAVFTAGDNAYADGSRRRLPQLLRPDLGRVQGPDPTGRRQPRLAARRISPATSATSGPRPRRTARAGTRTTSGRGTSSCSIPTAASVGGCGPASAQGRWLTADLAASTAACTLAIWHHPRFSSGEHGNDTAVAPFWHGALRRRRRRRHQRPRPRLRAVRPAGPERSAGPRARHPRVRGRDRRGGAADLPDAARPTASSASRRPRRHRARAPPGVLRVDLPADDRRARRLRDGTLPLISFAR